MGRRGHRRRLARGISVDAIGISGRVTVRGVRQELRFPHGTPTVIVQRDLEVRRQQLEKLVPEAPGRGTLADIVRRYLARVPEPARPTRAWLLQPWIDALGDEPMYLLTKAALSSVTDGWRQAGLSASRTNKRISALRVAWRAVAPDEAPVHAIERITRYTEPRPIMRGVPLALVEEILQQVTRERSVKRGRPPAPSKSAARLRVLAYTGQPPAIVMKIRPEHVRWTATPPELYVSPRRKGDGVDDAWLPILPQAAAALRGFFAAGAGGAFQVPALARVLVRALKKTRTALEAAGRHDEAAQLEGFRLYDLRHSFLGELALEAPDIYAVQDYARHASLQTTTRYMRRAAPTRTKTAIAKLAAILPPVPPASAPDGERKRGRKRGAA